MVLVAVLRTEKSRSSKDTRKDITKLTKARDDGCFERVATVEDSKLWLHLFFRQI